MATISPSQPSNQQLQTIQQKSSSTVTSTIKTAGRTSRLLPALVSLFAKDAGKIPKRSQENRIFLQENRVETSP